MLVLARGPRSRTTLVVPPSDTPTTIVVFIDEFSRLSTSNPVVRIGFEAPREVSILREEAAVRHPPAASTDV